jgi:sortase A
VAGVRTALRGVGQTLITAGVIILLFVVYELWVTGLYAAHAQAVLRKEPLPPLPSTGPGDIRFGHALGVIFIPRLGAGYSKVIVQGDSTADLRKGGPGHIPSTALPGQLGNSVLSGHRTTYGAPFNRIDEIRTGDPIVIETKEQWLVFRETRQLVVNPDDLGVTLPVPFHPGAVPTLRRLTLTTCDPKYSATHRRVVFAVLLSRQPRTAGRPAVLESGG